MSAPEQVRTSLGRCWRLEAIGDIDAHPDVLASGLPFFVAWEFDLMRDLSAEHRATLWRGRCAAALAEREDRARDGKRTAFTGTKPIAAEATPPEDSWL